MKLSPTLLGWVGTVSGSTISVRQSTTVDSGILLIGGKSYRVGQVGSFVRIPQGYHHLYGIVAEVGANAIPPTRLDARERDERWMSVQLVGEIVSTSFERGISQYPSINDEVHLVTEEDLAVIYGTVGVGQVEIGRLANADGVGVRIDIDKLVTRHSAVLGSTGSGKSTTVASLLKSITLGTAPVGRPQFPSARILLLDIHGEYGRALASVSRVFRVNPGRGESSLDIPFWALDTTDLLQFLMGRLEEKQTSQILDYVYNLKSETVRHGTLPGANLTSLTSDSPIPFSLKRLWLELIEPEIKTWEDIARSKPALQAPGDMDSLTAPIYKPHGSGSTPPFINSIGVLGIRRPLDQMRSRLLDRQYDFLLHPGDWEPDKEGVPRKDLPDLLLEWLGHDRSITILDLSGIPSLVITHLIGAILRIIYDGLFWGREKSEGGVSRPLLVVMEEAHRYLSKESTGPAKSMVQRIVKEGRKFGVGAMIVSQRPSEVDETILSQCGTFVTLRLSNSADRSKVQATLPDNLAGVIESLPILRTGEAIVVGEAAHLPIRCRIGLPAEEFRPNSEDPRVSERWGALRSREDYSKLAASWRSQNPYWAELHDLRKPLSNEENNAVEREPVASSNVAAIGYDPSSETLEVEFLNGGVYQYYNVPKTIYQSLISASSKGQFLHAYIKNTYPWSRV